MSSDDSDDDLLANLLANIDEDSEPAKTDISEETKPSALKEIDFNFLDDNFGNLADESSKLTSPKTINDHSDSVLDKHNNSSDDEDQKYFEKQHYSNYGREIKNLLKNKESEKVNFISNFKKENILDGLSNNINNKSKNTNLNSYIHNPSSSNSVPLENNDKYSLKVPINSNNSTQKDVYKDPIFGLKIIKPLVSSAELTEKMQGRKAVSVSTVKMHLMNQFSGNCDGDWVIAGVIISKTPVKTSQKGNQYCIWKISDLSTDMKTVSIFLFSSAFKNFWKLSTGSVVGILNPSVLESKDYKDLATLSVDNSLKIMVLGTSRDLGKCKAMKKNGEPCTTPVNLSVCEYCIYHVKQEYGKYSRRSELQTAGPKRAFTSPNNPMKKVGISQQRHPEALPFVAIPAKRNEALYKKDCERLALLKGNPKALGTINSQTKIPCNIKTKITSTELSSNQVKKDFERLNKLRGTNVNLQTESPTTKEERNTDFKFSLSSPKLGTGMRAGIIDFSEPVSKNLVHKAKLTAIEWVKKNGAIKKSNPNKIRPSKEDLNEKGIKRKREDEQSEEIAEEAKRKSDIKTKFQEMLEMKSTHSDLIEKRDDEETEKYFNKLEVKERMEEKMMSTFKVACKAVHCKICKYTAFSSSDLCKTLKHPIKVIDAEKRFFKCADCGNRTVSLDRIPTETCKKCSSSKWIKSAMMDEKRTELTKPKLCIRGGEEKFIGSTANDAYLDMLFPD